jgi:hypothetical protein
MQQTLLKQLSTVESRFLFVSGSQSVREATNFVMSNAMHPKLLPAQRPPDMDLDNKRQIAA